MVIFLLNLAGLQECLDILSTGRKETLDLKHDSVLFWF